VLARIRGSAKCHVRAGDYADARLARSVEGRGRGLSAGDVVRAIREQNVQVAAGVVGGPPMPERVSLPTEHQRPRPPPRRAGVRRRHRQGGGRREVTRLRTWPGSAGGGRLRVPLDARHKEAVAIAIFQAPGPLTPSQLSSAVRATMAELQKNFPMASSTGSSTTHDQRARRPFAKS